ncbi:MAG: FtsX-like permease family protein [Tannerella sp.]|jgi:putative ABC transport system permease protein|nr:FtsX-like permease family protein [Tannerella sp.]
MIKHVFKIIANQWRKNVWIVIELFIALSILWFTVDFFSVMWLTTRTPPGFDIKDTYLVRIALTPTQAPGYVAYEEGSEEPGRNFQRLVERLRLMPGIEAVCTGKLFYPYCTGAFMNSFSKDSLNISPFILTITPEYFDVFKVKSADGAPTAQLKTSLLDGYIVSKTMEEKLFPGNSAKGKDIYVVWQGDTVGTYRISNVVQTMKRNEYVRPDGYIFYPFTESELMKMTDRQIWESMSIGIRTQPGGNPKAMVAKLENELKNSFEAGNFSLAGVTPISELRDYMLWNYGVYDTLQYSTFFTIFFLVNVFLGVLGTFWLRINKRREEIGIRMALGSSRRRVVSQMQMESFVLILIASVPAVLVWVNIVIAELLSTDRYDITVTRLALNSVITLGLIVLAAALATWYPARKAASMPAAEALRYE